MKALLFGLMALFLTGTLSADPLTPEQAQKVQAKLAVLKTWGSAPEVIAGVKLAPSAWMAEMTQDKWKGLSVLSPEIKELSKNPLAVWLKSQKDDTISEIFVSRADGTKAALLAKTTSWSHKGAPKHDVPMTGKTWVGEAVADESTGLKQVQVSFPVMDGGKVIGSVVVGLQVSKL